MFCMLFIYNYLSGMVGKWDLLKITGIGMRMEQNVLTSSLKVLKLACV